MNLKKNKLDELKEPNPSKSNSNSVFSKKNVHSIIQNWKRKMNDFFDLKYNMNSYKLHLVVTNKIIYDERRHVVSRFKEFLLWDEVSEFLKRFYSVKEVEERMPNIFDYYTHTSIITPNYAILKANKIILKSTKRKKRIMIMENQDESIEVKSRKDLKAKSYSTFFKEKIEKSNLNNFLDISNSKHFESLSYYSNPNSIYKETSVNYSKILFDQDINNVSYNTVNLKILDEIENKNKSSLEQNQLNYKIANVSKRNNLKLKEKTIYSQISKTKKGFDKRISIKRANTNLSTNSNPTKFQLNLSQKKNSGIIKYNMKKKKYDLNLFSPGLNIQLKDKQKNTKDTESLDINHKQLLTNEKLVKKKNFISNKSVSNKKNVGMKNPITPIISSYLKDVIKVHSTSPKNFIHYKSNLNTSCGVLILEKKKYSYNRKNIVDNHSLSQLENKVEKKLKFKEKKYQQSYYNSNSKNEILHREEIQKRTLKNNQVRQIKPFTTKINFPRCNFIYRNSPGNKFKLSNDSDLFSNQTQKNKIQQKILNGTKRKLERPTFENLDIINFIRMHENKMNSNNTDKQQSTIQIDRNTPSNFYNINLNVNLNLNVNIKGDKGKVNNSLHEKLLIGENTEEKDIGKSVRNLLNLSSKIEEGKVTNTTEQKISSEKYQKLNNVSVRINLDTKANFQQKIKKELKNNILKKSSQNVNKTVKTTKYNSNSTNTNMKCQNLLNSKQCLIVKK